MSGFRTTARRLRALASALIAFCALLGSAALPAATVPTGFSDSTVVTGLASPTAMEIAPDGRIFVSQQSGALRATPMRGKARKKLVSKCFLPAPRVTMITA